MTEPTIDPALVLACMGDASDGVRQLTDDVATLAQQYRQHDLGAANVGTIRLAIDLQALVVLVQSLRGTLPSNTSLQKLPSEAALEQLVSLLESVVTAQAANDWLTVADILEYDLHPKLQEWFEKFDEVRKALAA